MRSPCCLSIPLFSFSVRSASDQRNVGSYLLLCLSYQTVFSRTLLRFVVCIISEIVISECFSRALMYESGSAESCLWKSQLEMEIGEGSRKIFNGKDNNMLLSLSCCCFERSVKRTYRKTKRRHALEIKCSLNILSLLLQVTKISVLNGSDLDRVS